MIKILKEPMNIQRHDLLYFCLNFATAKNVFSNEQAEDLIN